MLILSRKCGETIMIGSNIELTVINVTGSRVQLGLRAPREIAVHREEVHQRIRRESIPPVDRSILPFTK